MYICYMSTLSDIKDEYGGVRRDRYIRTWLKKSSEISKTRVRRRRKRSHEIDENNSVIDAGMSLDRFNQIYQTSLESDEGWTRN